MTFFKKITSLTEKASYQVAINLCQDMTFKEEAMCLEKPTYGLILYDRESPYFIGGQNILSIVSKLKSSDGSSDSLLFSKAEDKLGDKVDLWETAIEEQCLKLTEKLPNFIKHEVHVWMMRIALEYLSYSRRQEMLFGVPCYFLMDFLTISDWTYGGRLNEIKIAKRLLKDERLMIFQRYRIACVYCLHIYIPQLWSRLTQEEKQSVSQDDDSDHQENNYLVLLWSNYMKGHPFQRNHLWSLAAQKSVHFGNQAALITCWKRLNQHKRRQIVIHMALQALKLWRKAKRFFSPWKYNLVSNKYRSSRKLFESAKHFNLPTYYGEMMRFFLSKMNERQQLLFFKSVFETGLGNYIMKCFLDWPLQDIFLPTMNLLWGIIPNKKYGQCLLSLANMAQIHIVADIHYYDFQSLLWALWEQTPESFKRYALCHKADDEEDSCNTVIKLLFLQLVSKSGPFQSRDVAFFKQIWCDLPEEEKKAILLSSIGGRIIFKLVKKEKWSLVNWMVQGSVPREEVSKFKEKLLKSNYDRVSSDLIYGCEEFVEKLIDWSFELISDKTQYKRELINYENYCANLCISFLKSGDFTRVERMINFCLDSDDEMKREFQLNIVKKSCIELMKEGLSEPIDITLACNFNTEDELNNIKNDKDVYNVNVFEDEYCSLCNLLEQIDTILAWNFKTKDEIKKFKSDKDLFNVNIVKNYCCALLKSKFSSPNKWEHLDKILAWKFDTDEAIKVIDYIHTVLYQDTNELLESLRCCLTTEKMVISFREVLEKRYFKNIENNEVKNAKARLDNLVSVLLHDFTRDHDETSNETTCNQDKGRKRF